ncbi:MAG TPA: sulfatase-like hydrolase/transferase [Vicinamibacteria bacterium]|nr:sulfatase-like hydrolase/transferase [Vicinamibacteria bacterium]
MRRASLLLLAVLGGSSLADFAAHGDSPPPDVVLVTLDTVRADRMGFLGSRRGLTPALDSLARQAVVFEEAFAEAPLTTVSHATILSGTHPPSHEVQDFGMPLPAAAPWLPALLHAAGYRTAAFVGSIVLDPKGGIASGFDRGFDLYDAGFERRRNGADPYKTKERRGDEVVARAIAWLDRRGSGRFFLWVHLYDAHDPYDPPEPYASRHAEAPYEGEIAGVDAAVGRLVDALRERGVLEGALVVVAADHGESLGEHGEDTHGVFLYDATIHVPLLLRLPGGGEAGRRVGGRVSLVDIAPTVLDAAGIGIPAAIQGRSLLGLARGRRESERPAYAESEYPRRVFGWSPLRSWRSERFLYVEAPRRELYDLRSDPGATRNIAEDRPAVADGMAAEIERARGAWSSTHPRAAATGPSPEVVERLASLGYAAGATGASPLPPTGVDPKDKIGVVNLLQRATQAGEEGRWDAAIPIYERVVATDPQIFTARLELGLALARRRDWARALPHLELVAERMPDYADARFALGLAYASLGRTKDAVRELKAALAKEPGHRPARALLEKLSEHSGGNE